MAWITPLNFQIFRQRDPRWASQRLGTVNGTTLGSHGCLISTIAMAQDAYSDQDFSPGQCDELFTNQRGYANGNLVVWTAIQRILPHVAHVGFDPCVTVPAPIEKLKQHLQNGGLAALQVGFGGIAANMHWVLADGFEGDDIIKCDPWYGDETGFGSKDSRGNFRFGSGIAARDILGIHYFAQGIQPTPPPAIADPPAKVVAKLPIEVPATEVEVTPPAPEPVVVPEPVVESEPTISKEDFYGYSEQGAGTYTIKREGAYAIDVETGNHVQALDLGTIITSVAGSFFHDGQKYFRTQNAVSEGWWRGIPVEFTEAPQGVIDGVYHADPAAVQYEEPEVEQPKPVKDKTPSLLEAIIATIREYLKLRKAK